MSNPFLGEIRAWGNSFAPRGWAFCQGQLLSIVQNTALFSLIGTYYGGNGTTNFGLPDLRGRAPLGYGTTPSGNVYDLGEQAGEETITLTSNTMPMHTHTISGTSAVGPRSKASDGCAYGTSSGGNAYYAAASSPTTFVNPGTVSPFAGGGQAHTNLQPYLVISWCIALSGIFPARN